MPWESTATRLGWEQGHCYGLLYLDDLLRFHHLHPQIDGRARYEQDVRFILVLNAFGFCYDLMLYNGNRSMSKNFESCGNAPHCSRWGSNSLPGSRCWAATARTSLLIYCAQQPGKCVIMTWDSSLREYERFQYRTVLVYIVSGSINEGRFAFVASCHTCVT